MLGLEMLGILTGLTNLADHFTGVKMGEDGLEMAGPGSWLDNGNYFAGNLISTTSSGSALISSLTLTSVDSLYREATGPTFRPQGAVKRWLNHRVYKDAKADDYVFSQDPILWTIRVVEGIEYTLGFGEPYEGDDLQVGSLLFTAFSEQMTSAFPDESWQGLGSGNYADRNAALRVRVAALADLDLQLMAFVKRQADVNTDVRVGLATLKGLLFAAYVVEQVLYAATPTASIAGRKWAYLACIFGNIAALAAITNLLGFSGAHKNKADAVADQYTQLATTGAGGAQSLVASDVPGSGRSMVAGFEDVISSRMPDMSTLAGVAGCREDDRAAVNVVSGVGETIEAHTRAETPCGTTPPVPSITMPTLAQVVGMSGQDTKSSGYHTRVTYLAGQAQQVASTAAQGNVGTAAEDVALVQAAQAAPGPGRPGHAVGEGQVAAELGGATTALTLGEVSVASRTRMFTA